ncbi:MAG: type II toxin-antitoxin system prevent-host-death family antitoxin [Bryobacteraceae bacterium]|nr:type II toxin-antitoxin system prevent-host-death family antitoxin [Bryobacteraceae bacterium]
MDMIGAFEATTHLASLLDRVAKGEKIIITRHGVPAALLVPVGPSEQKLSHKEIVEGMRELRKRVKPGTMSVRDMVNEGRRY